MDIYISSDTRFKDHLRVKRKKKHLALYVITSSRTQQHGHQYILYHTLAFHCTVEPDLSHPINVTTLLPSQSFHYLQNPDFCSLFVTGLTGFPCTCNPYVTQSLTNTYTLIQHTEIFCNKSLPNQPNFCNMQILLHIKFVFFLMYASREQML